jgi:hypothetical protein
MGKRLKRSEKLDLILSGLEKLRAEVKKLVKNRAAVTDHRVKAKPGSIPERPKKVPKQTDAGKKPVGDVAPSKPVLVQAPRVPQPTSRTASHYGSVAMSCCKLLLAPAVALSVVLLGLGEGASARTTYKRSKANVTRSLNQEMSRQKKAREEQHHYQVSQKHSSHKWPPKHRRHRN